jgi:CubicO group peptidase (beta-lactamase class C family)
MRVARPALLVLVSVAAPWSARAEPALDQRLRTAIERKDVPGVVVIAGDRGRVLYQGAFGMAEAGAGRPMTADAIFRIASMTKPVTAVAALQLIEAGKLALDDPAAKYLPELGQPMVFESFDAATGEYKLRPATAAITVRHLFTHTSGLGYGFTSAVLDKFKPRDGERYPVGPLLFEPGTQWIYGTSTDHLGKIVEKISGQDLETYFREHIFTPLGMKDTSYNVPAEKQARLVNAHRRGADGAVAEQPRTPPSTATRFNGGGGLYSTAGDYLRFLQMLLNGGELNGARVLSRKSVALIGQNQIGVVGVRAVKSTQPSVSGDFTFVDDNRDKWGLGFQITTAAVPGKRSAGSLSWGGINNTYFWLDSTRGVAGVIMMQFMPFADVKALRIYDAFERGVYELVQKGGAR